MERVIPSAPSASALQGLWFVFHHAGHHIALWISSFTGREELYLDGALVAERRKIALTSSHEFTVGETRYVVELSTRKMRRGVFDCVLRANGVSVAALETEYVVHRRGLQSVIVIAGTAAVIYSALKSDASLYSYALGVVAVSVVVYAWLGRRNSYAIRTNPVLTGLKEGV
jgi:hypothetical protein